MTMTLPSSVIRNPIGWQERLARLRGSPIRFDLSAYDNALLEINRLESELRGLANEQLMDRAQDFRNRAMAGTPLESLRVPFFALVREASWRALGLRPFDVQIVAALALDDGQIVEMQTGEGKTLVAVMPASLNALTGRGVHVLTFNDYLAQRDAEWMGPIYRLLGSSVGFVQQGMSPDDRSKAYHADVTYVTAKEAGFDHLRDLLATDPRQLVHRPFHVALVDEADSLLVDEARIPLVIAGNVGREVFSAARLSRLVASFTPGAQFSLDEYGRNVELTEPGIELVERELGCGNLHAEHNYTLLSELNCALHAHALLRRDVDYIVRDGRIEIVDEFTGRVVRDRHWPDGLQAAVEAKEGLEHRRDGRILGSITLQHFLNGYSHLCGMTGTAQGAASELAAFYGIETVVMPTHRPLIRNDYPDVVFTHREAKETGLVEEIRHVHAIGRPILVGTLTVEESERLAARLRAAGIECEVLNARNDAAEASVVARAGMAGAVTISTNMAGRGTDIRLGGENGSDHERVAALGGLYVIGTNRHESARVDQQLRGRAGRQGDPGASRFFVSLEDDLMVRFRLQDLIAGRLVSKPRADQIESPVVRAEIARAQRIIESQNFEIRRTLWRYASVVEDQRRQFMERRQAILVGDQTPDVWQREEESYLHLIAAAGEPAVRRAEQLVTLSQFDRAWRDHLALVADLREGIHLVGLGGQDPLTRFTADVRHAFSGIEDAIERGIIEALPRVRGDSGGIDLKGLDVKGPSSTWTYLVNDDPFKNQIGMMLTGPGRTSIAIYSAVMLMPLFLLWGLVDRFVGRRARQRDAHH
ncbi:MAG TPA: accessory Sec system translocase SecA2 [Vicinamibacterales bacterium]|jgi:preprotein translocase subunit SecA